MKTVARFSRDGAALLLVSSLLLTSPAFGHGDEVHGDAAAVAPAASIDSKLGFGSTGNVFEVVVTPTAEHTAVYVALADTNEPVAGAVVEIEVTGSTVWAGTAEPTNDPGIYLLNWTAPAQGRADLAVTVTVGDKADLLLIQGVMASIGEPPPAVTGAGPTGLAVFSRGWLPWAAGGVLLVLTAGVVALRSRRRTVQAVLLALILLPLAGQDAAAHGDEDHGGAPEPVVAAPASGMVSLPKASQFLLGIRTIRAEQRSVAESVRLVGKVLPDPAGYARLQPAQTSRVLYDPNYPVPAPGQLVKRGQVLAVVEPTLTNIERSDKQAALYKTESEIALLERQLARWNEVSDLVVRKEVDAARAQLAQLRQQRAQLAGTALGREVLRAPVDGRVTDVHLVPGEIRTPEDILIEIVDPERLHVEAVLYDFQLAGRISGARATTRLLPDETFDLTLIGVSPSVSPEDQGLHLHFAVKNPRGLLRLGMPVDVYAETGTTRLVVAAPRDALSDQGGRSIVFVHVAPEAFEARPVRVARSIGSWTEIEGGMQAGERVVVQGVAQLRAIR